MVASIAADAATVEPGTNLAGEPRDTLVFDRAAADVAPAPAGIDPDALRQRGALTRALMMAGALDRMSRLTVEYTRQRRQFGRPVAQFQAVQQHLVHGAQEAALVTMAAEVAATAAERGPAAFEIAAAKVLAGQAAASATRAAHQAHGAMGMTQEYPLQHLSRRLWSWRQRVRRRHVVERPARPGVGRRRRRRPLPVDHRRVERPDRVRRRPPPAPFRKATTRTDEFPVRPPSPWRSGGVSAPCERSR